MHRLSFAFQRYKQGVIAHPFGAVVIGLICITILIASAQSGKILQASAYLGAVALCALTTDLVVGKGTGTNTFIIKRSPSRELLVILFCTGLGAIFLCIRFFCDWEHFPGLLKLVLTPLLIFSFPIALAVIYLFVYKYKFRELGIKFQYWYLPIFLHIIWGGLTFLAAPEQIHFLEAYQQNGIIGYLIVGILGAALSEEFTRMLIQTRMAATTNNVFTGWFIATVIWSAMHIPIGYIQDQEHFTLASALLGTIAILPIGMFWGYLTYRTQSLIPVLLMHGFNLWGLQSF